MMCMQTKPRRPWTSGDRRTYAGSPASMRLLLMVEDERSRAAFHPPGGSDMEERGGEGCVGGKRKLGGIRGGGMLSAG